MHDIVPVAIVVLHVAVKVTMFIPCMQLEYIHSLGGFIALQADPISCAQAIIKHLCVPFSPSSMHAWQCNVQETTEVLEAQLVPGVEPVSLAVIAGGCSSVAEAVARVSREKGVLHVRNS